MSFSCPDLNIREMVAAARVYGYTGIEPRLDSGHKHGIEVAAADADIKEAASIAAERTNPSL